MEPGIHDRIGQLGDLGLAVLVSLISEQHALISTEEDLTGTLTRELELLCNETFALSTAVVECSPKTTLDGFSESILVGAAEEDRGYSSDAYEADRINSTDHSNLDDRRIADVIIAVNLDLTDASVQVQALELLRTKRIFTRTSMHLTSSDFLMLVVTSTPGARLTHHLNDCFAMSHFHPGEDGFPHLEGTDDIKSAIIGRGQLKMLRQLAAEARITGEIAAYLHNVVIFLRMSRYVRGGVTAAATRHLRALAKALAPLHGQDYVSPSLVTLAARKIYPHRLLLATANTERSLQWGSDPEAVKQNLQGVTIEDVLEDVLATVETPL